MSIYSRYKYDRAMDDNFRSRVRSHYMRSLWARGWLLFAVFLILRLAATHTLSEQTISAASKPPAIADFIDIASPAGLSASNVFGGKESSTYILESTGTGAAIFDYDNDGWPDIFLVNGTRLDGFDAQSVPTSHLYRNNHDGTFTDVTEKAGLVASGWGQGVCIGDSTTTAGTTFTSRTTEKTGSTTIATALSKRWQTQRASPVTERLGEAAAPSWITIGMGSSTWPSRTMRTSTLHMPPPRANIPPVCGRALLSFAGPGACLAAGTFSTATSATEPSRTWVFFRAWPTTSTAASRQAWAPRLQITMAMGIWIFSARTSPTTHPRFITTMATAPLPTSPIPRGLPPVSDT